MGGGRGNECVALCFCWGRRRAQLLCSSSSTHPPPLRSLPFHHYYHYCTVYKYLLWFCVSLKSAGCCVVLCVLWVLVLVWCVLVFVVVVLLCVAVAMSAISENVPRSRAFLLGLFHFLLIIITRIIV